MLSFIFLIKQILKEKKSLNIPFLGTFKIQNSSAKYLYSENIFIPPQEKILFYLNTSIKNNQLIELYSRKKNIPFFSAENEIKEICSNILNQLLDNKIYQIPEFGSLYYTQFGEIEFIQEMPLYSSSLGLSKYTIYTINNTNHSIKEKHNQYHFHINRNIFNYSLSILFFIIFYFLYASPLNINKYNKIPPFQQSSLLYNQQDPISLPKKENNTINNNPSDSIFYTIVIASHITKSNANEYIYKIKKTGITDLSFIRYNNIPMIIYGHYKNKNEAQDNMKLLKNNLNITDTWITKIHIK